MDTACSSRTLSMEFKRIQDDPVEGFLVQLNDNNLYIWDVAIFGPPDTIYEGGYFKAHMTFPLNYPYSPPKLRFAHSFWHPNVYENGQICISILHPSTNDPTSGELPSERWNPTQSVRTVLLSVISMLNEPNIHSPANVDASKMYQQWKQTNGTDKEYEEMVKRIVESSKLEAAKDDIVVPTTVQDYCLTKFTIGANGKARAKRVTELDDTVMSGDDYYDDSYLFDDDVEEEEDDDEEEEEEEEEKDDKDKMTAKNFFDDDYYNEDYLFEDDDDEDVEDDEGEEQAEGQTQDAQNKMEVTTQADVRDSRDPAIE